MKLVCTKAPLCFGFFLVFSSRPFACFEAWSHSYLFCRVVGLGWSVVTTESAEVPWMTEMMMLVLAVCPSPNASFLTC